MIIKNKGEFFSYQDEKYEIGALVIANKNSIYNSLYGIITEIRTDKDKETENPTIDIYCDFQLPPTLTDNYTKFIDKFKHEDNYLPNLNQVIMSPDMLNVCRAKDNDEFVYILRQAWASLGEPDSCYSIYKDYDKAKYNFNICLQEEISNGIIKSNISHNMSIFESGDHFEACANEIMSPDYYKIDLEKALLID